jgi:hypothetical protein
MYRKTVATLWPIVDFFDACEVQDMELLKKDIRAPA